ncbi:transcriptional regulator [Actinoplanes sp. NPDC049668]|uniref:AfsR/SARP family transcriptional regulator n=1 Tax=unclassified Actinoplanes TaxID=2626549 RepID=UPI0033BE367F
MTQLRFLVLGPLTVAHSGPVELGPLKQRLTLAMLLARPDTFVPVETLCEAVWTEAAAPRTARKNLQVYISNLRRLLDDRADRLVHEAGGYRLRVDADELDSLQFRALVRAARQAHHRGAALPAAQHFRHALRLWRGAPFAGLHRSHPLAAEARRLEGQHLQVLEEWAETELEIGNYAAVADALTEHAERHPQRERLRAAQMTALFRSGRQAEALQVFEDVRRQLAAAYGLQPTPALEKLYRSILAEQRGHPRPAAAPQSLPQDLPDFVGRTEQLGEMTDVVRHSTRQVIVVTGPAGIGKTTLAVRLAHTLQHDFPGGRILLRMREPDGTPRTTVDLLAELAALTGLSDRMTGHPDQDSFHWRAWLGERRMLLMLDDAPDETAVRPLVHASGAATVVVTSRRRMTGLADAHRIDVPSLTCPEAVELLAQIIGRDRTTADPSAANAVVTAIGRLPLAVRIGGLKLAAMRLLPLREFAERLASSRTVLDELVAGDLAVRPRIADSWYGMSRAHRTDVSQLAALPAPSLTLQDAATTLSCPPDEARRRLESLVDTGALLSPEPTVTARSIRYELPALVRLYARECGTTSPNRRSAVVS